MSTFRDAIAGAVCGAWGADGSQYLDEDVADSILATPEMQAIRNWLRGVHPDGFDERPTYHVNIHTGRTVEEILAKVREKYPPVAPGLRERISTLEALTDQLAEAAGLIAEVDDDMYHDPDPGDILWDRCHPTVQQVRDAIRAVRAYEADKEAHRG